MRQIRTVPALVVLLAAASIGAQESTSYKLAEHAFNAGGHPAAGAVPLSASYRMSLDAVGDAVVGTGPASASYRMSAGFASCYPPPGEVRGLRFGDRQTLYWDPERSTGSYNLYRGLMANLSSGGYGDCEQQDLADETATDGTDPPAGDGYLYLVTARNRLNEEGTKGAGSDGAERPNLSPCP